MSTNIERAAEVIAETILDNVDDAAACSHRPENVNRLWQDANARGLIGERSAEALAAEGLLVTDEQQPCPHIRTNGDDHPSPGYSWCSLNSRPTWQWKTLTDEQQRLIALGKAVERMRGATSWRRGTPTTTSQRVGWNACLDAIHAEAAKP